MIRSCARRKVQEFQSKLDEAAIAGTRDHMLGAQLLDAAHYPAIHLQSEQIRSQPDGLYLSARITVREHTVTLDVPLALQRSPDQLIASGEFDLTHAELGLTPYSVALGALRVADRMHVRYRLVASRDCRSTCRCGQSAAEQQQPVPSGASISAPRRGQAARQLAVSGTSRARSRALLACRGQRIRTPAPAHRRQRG